MTGNPFPHAKRMEGLTRMTRTGEFGTKIPFLSDADADAAFLGMDFNALPISEWRTIHVRKV